MNPSTLRIRLSSGNETCVTDYMGHVVLLALITRSDCGCNYLVHALDTMTVDFGPLGFQALVGMLDILPNEAIPELQFRYPAGACSRRNAADYLGIPMSGFAIPQLVFFDRGGVRRAVYDRTHDFCRDAVANSRQLITTLLGESADPVNGSKQAAAEVSEGLK